jgi:hypothetical protein
MHKVQMQHRMRRVLLLSLLSLSMSACELVGDIFQAGLVVGIIGIILVIAIIGWIFGKFRGRGRKS